MKVIGLCGGSGSGKGTVALLFQKFGIASIDTDAVYHSLASVPGPCLEELCRRFGREILDNTGGLDRAKLRRVVFSEPDREQKQMHLNSITHRYVLEEVRRILDVNRDAGYSATLVDAPMLFESGFHKECDKVIAVVAEDNLRIARIMIRDSISYEDAVRRLGAQKSNEFLIENSDYVIYNNSDIDALTCAVGEIAKEIKK